MFLLSRIAALFVLFGFLYPVNARADVKMPDIFGDHMVLQQDIKIPVWGWADAGETVTVTLGDKTAKTTADANGKWRVDLDPVATAATPLTLTVTGKNSLKFTDVLVGDVWVCSGQSNMAFPLESHTSFGGAANAATAVPAANDPQLRFFKANSSRESKKNPWEICTPDTAARFSAVGYFFGQEMRHDLNHPIGLISAHVGGTPAQMWLSLSALQKDPPFTNYVDAYQKAMAFQATQKESNEAANYKKAVKAWQEAVKQAQASGQPAPPRPKSGSASPVKYTPTLLFERLIAPLMPYAIKGVIWYQGESNGGNGLEYRTLFPRLISDWREKWNQGDFPFLFVQLANYKALQTDPSEGGWAELREAQLKTLALPNTGMAVAIDIGDANTIHPKDKLDVGLRLALAARHVAYGQDLVYSGPIYDSMKIEGNKIRLTFKDTGSGLQMSTPPFTPTGAPVPAPTELKGFAIAGADKNFVWAKAQIDGSSVLVSSDQVASPVAVRYGWANNPPCNLYNKEGLPASPFRTDDWEDEKHASAAPPSKPDSAPEQ